MSTENVNTQDAATGAVKSSPLLEDDPFDTPEHQQFVEEMAEHCQCCIQCSQVPCDGVLAGGLCDSMCTCECEDDDPQDIYDRDVWGDEWNTPMSL